MKKGGVKTSGVLTLILYIFLFVIAAAAACSQFGVQAVNDIIQGQEILAKVMVVALTAFVAIPQTIVLKFVPSMDAELLTTIFVCAFLALTVLMLFWGIKEITIAKKDDASFVKCKKTCGFMMFVKLLIFIYFLALTVCQFVLEEVKFIVMLFELVIGMQYIFAIVTGFMAVFTFITYLLPVINFSKAAKAYAGGENYQDPNAQQYYDPNTQQYYDPNAQYAAQPTMQANMPPMPGYQPQYNNAPQPIYSNEPPPQPSIQSQFNPQVQAEEQQRANSILPGQNGVPLNITPEGIADLERLERLRNSGAITEENYIAMRNKICNSKIS